MLDFMLRGISDSTASHIKAMARDRNWSLNDVLLDLIERGLRARDQDDHAEVVVTPMHHDIARLAGTWDPAEAAAFRAAMEAFEDLPADEPAPAPKPVDL